MSDRLLWTAQGAAVAASFLATYIYLLCYQNKLPRPHLDFWLDLWFFQVSTEIMHERAHDLTTTYVSLQLTIRYKHGMRFRLYNIRTR